MRESRGSERVLTLKRGFWSGVGAGLAFIVVELIARVVGSVPTLPELVQDRLVLSVPGPLFSFFLDRLLYLGKPLLFGTLLLGLVLLAGLIGGIAGRWGRIWLIAVVLWLLLGFIVLPLVGHGIFAGSVAVAVINLVALVVYALAFTLFQGGSPQPGKVDEAAALADAPTPDPVPAHVNRIDRRRLLGGGVLGLAVVGLAWRAVGREPQLPPRGGTPVSGGSAAPLPQSPLAADASSAAPGLPPAVTPADRFYIVSKNLLDPRLDGGKWRVRIDGLVDRPLQLGQADLLEMPALTEYRTLECISNEVGGDLISNGRWTGVRFLDFFQRAGVQAAATAVQFTCADGYTSDLTLQQALDPATVLVYRLNDADLPFKHGFPARVLTPATYGMKNPKWVTRMELVRAARPGFWQQQGWDQQGIVQTMAQVDSPQDGALVPASGVDVGGIAFAGARGITRVECSTDGGSSWKDARLLPSLGPNTWTFWQFTWQPPSAGAYTIVARATDGTGALQSARRTDPFPVGATGFHEIHVRVGV
jgi:DMSO/TMAO reductase YedYZ molybdopterin-dependent catalytic subunit